MSKKIYIRRGHTAVRFGNGYATKAPPGPFKRVSNVKGCWYFRTVFECPGCGALVEFKQRRLPPRPESHGDTFEHQLRHCGCTSRTIKLVIQ